MPQSGVSLLSAECINTRLNNVLDQAESILVHLLVDGLLSSGYLPFEEPLTEADVKRMTPDQLMGLLATIQDPGQKLAVLKALDLPLEEIYDLMEGSRSAEPQEGVNE